MQSTDQDQAKPGPAPPAQARLLMQQDRTGRGLLDGGWWPRTNDPAVELQVLIPELDERHGRITRVMIGTADWDGTRPRLLSFSGPRGRRVVKLGWFDSMPAGLLTAISASGERTDLVTIPRRPARKLPRRPCGRPSRLATVSTLRPFSPPLPCPPPTRNPRHDPRRHRDCDAAATGSADEHDRVAAGL